MTSVRQLASETRRYVRQSLFGNNHSAATNLRYAGYQRACRDSWRPAAKPTPEQEQAGARFAENGFEVLPPPRAMSAETIDQLRTKVDRLFESQKGGLPVSQGLTRLVDGYELVPEITDFFDGELEGVLESYYQSHFKLFAISFYRTTPTPSKPESSFLWHVDNCPRQEIKLMVYLDPVTYDTGAIRLKTRGFSDDVRSRGFRDRKRYPMFENELDNSQTTRAVEGPAGTRILFQNGQAIHRAVSPQREHRDVVTFVIIPSTIPWRPHLARNRNFLSTNAGICIDPFNDKPEHIGYNY